MNHDYAESATTARLVTANRIDNTVTSISGSCISGTVSSILTKDDLDKIINPPVTRDQCSMSMTDYKGKSKRLVKVFTKDGEEKFKDDVMSAIDTVQVFNNNTVKVKFCDGTVITSTCAEGDTFNLEYGIALCLMKKLIGSKECVKIIEYGVKTYHRQQEEIEQAKIEAEERARIEAKEKARKEANDRRLADEERARRVSEMAEAIVKSYDMISSRSKTTKKSSPKKSPKEI